MTPVRIHRHPCGPRVYLAGCRVHHGPAGIAGAIAAAALGRRRVAIALAAWAATDLRDFPFRDCDNHVPRRVRNRPQPTT